MIRCLVTGGAGYVGSHLCKALAKEGFEPVVFDDLYRGHREFVKWGPLVEGKLADARLLDEVFQKYRPEAVFHFAGLTYVGESVKDPSLYYVNNYLGTLSLLEAMRRGSCGKIIFSSTAATYGEPKYVPIDEKHTQSPINPYGNSKLFIEKTLDDYEKAYGFKFAALRYFNASGADPDGEIGELHDPETHLIPLVVMAAMGERADIKIFGTDYSTDDGTAIRDYVHVNDLASAHIKALRLLDDGHESMKLNLGTGCGNSVRKIISAVEAVSGRKVKVIEAPRRAGDPPLLVADPKLAEETLSWKCRYRDIKDIVSTAWNWHSKNKYFGI